VGNDAHKQPIQVLVVDDDPTTRMVIRASVSQWGYEVEEAQDGKEAYDYLRAGNLPDILLLDWVMPEMDGLSLCNHLREEDIELPYIIFVSYNSGLSQIVKAIESGASEFISKPLNVSELRIRLLSAAQFLHRNCL